MLYLDGIRMPSPSRMETTVSDIGSAKERALDGTLLIDRRAVKRVIKLRWNALTREKIRLLCEGTAEPYFDVELPDPVMGELLALRCCRTAFSAGLMCADALLGTVWKDVQMELTER